MRRVSAQYLTLLLVACLFCLCHSQNNVVYANTICNATNTTSNATLNLLYFASEGYHNVSSVVHLPNGTTTVEEVGLSFCTPKPFYAGNELCGEAYVAVMRSTCAESMLFDTINGDVQLVNETTATLSIRDSRTMMTTLLVDFRCIAGLDTVVADWLDSLTLVLSSEISCQGFQPIAPTGGSGDDDNMLSKGSIVGIIIGVVATVVITAAIVQWRSRSNTEDQYQAI